MYDRIRITVSRKADRSLLAMFIKAWEGLDDKAKASAPRVQGEV
jgi:hypothetical protein